MQHSKPEIETVKKLFYSTPFSIFVVRPHTRLISRSVLKHTLLRVQSTSHTDFLPDNECMYPGEWTLSWTPPHVTPPLPFFQTNSISINWYSNVGVDLYCDLVTTPVFCKCVCTCVYFKSRTLTRASIADVDGQLHVRWNTVSSLVTGQWMTRTVWSCWRTKLILKIVKQTHNNEIPGNWPLDSLKL